MSKNLQLYNVEKTFHVSDDEIYMDIFRFFASRDMDLDATILAEKELAIVADRGIKNNSAIEEEVKTQEADEVMKDVESTQHNKEVSRAE